MAIPYSPQGFVNTIVPPSSIPDNTASNVNGVRMLKDSSQVVGSMFPTKHLAALSGYYYTFSSPLSSGLVTGLAQVTSLVALTEASPYLIIENTSNLAVGVGPNIMLDFVRVQSTAIAAAATDLQYAWKLDNVRNKWASAGTTITALNSNMGVTGASVGTIHQGALVVATAQQSSSSARVIGSGFWENVSTAPAQIIGEMIDFRFGALEAPLPNVMSNVASAGAHTFPVGLCAPMPPVILTPGTTATLFLWGVLAASAPSYVVQGGWYEF